MGWGSAYGAAGEEIEASRAGRGPGREGCLELSSSSRVVLRFSLAFKRACEQMEDKDVVFGTFIAECVAGSWSSRNNLLSD